MSKSHFYLHFVVACTILFVANSPVTIAQTIVLPPGLADTEGNRLHNPGAPYPGGEPLVANGGRVQELHVASEFLSFVSGPLAIRGLAFRPDVSVNAAVDTNFELTALRLSTTTAEPGSLNSTFSENYGDDVTTVFAGTVNLQTDGVQLGAAPHDFDYVFDFEPEFVYDPGEGNLLVEFVLGGGRTWHDGHEVGDGLDRFLLALGTNPTEATFMTDVVSVKQFTISELGQTFPILGGDVEELWASERGNNWLEGPAYDRVGGLWFAAGGQVFGDDPTSLLRYELATGSTETVLGFDVNPRVAGLAFDGQGRLIATQGGPASQGFLGGLGVTRRSVDQLDQYEVLMPSEFEEMPIMLNDLVLDSEGGIFVTQFAFPPTPGADSVFYISPQRDVLKAVTGPLTSNGIGISPDEKTLYVLSQFSPNITAFDINDDHTLSNERVLVQLENFGDGMTVDRHGNLYVSDLGANEIPEGGITGIPDSMVRVFSPLGEEILKFKPPHGAINMTFGAPDDTLYITGWNVLQRVPISFVADLGDCDGDGVLGTADLACVSAIAQRDAVLASLNALPGDLDGNGDVAFPDFLTLSSNFGADGNYTAGNVDLVGGIGFADFLILSTNFGKTKTGAAVAVTVPEPLSLALLGQTAVLIWLARRRVKHREC